MTNATTKRTITAFSAGFTTVIVSIFLFTVWKSHVDVNDHARQRAQEIARTLEEHVIRTFRSADHTLDVVASQMSAHLATNKTDGLKFFLKAHTQNAQELQHIILYDGGGDVVASDNGLAMLPREGSQKDQFLADMGGSSKYDINARLIHDATRQHWYIAISQPIVDMENRLLGTVVGLIPSTFINAFYNTFALDELDSMSLFHVDGTAMARIPYPEKLVGRSFATGTLFSQVLPKKPRGVSQAPKKTDGVQHLVAHAKVAGLPFVVTVGIKQDRMLSAWWQQFSVLLPVFLAAILVVVGLTIVLLRYLGRLQNTEATLSQEIEFTSQLLNREGAALIVLDEVGRITRINDTTCALTGYDEKELVGRAFSTLLLAGAVAWSLDRTRAETLVRQGAYQRELPWMTQGGQTCIMLCSFSVLKDKFDRPSFLAISAVDLSERVEREEELRTQATSDALTGILNRRHFLDLGGREFKKSMRLGRSMSVLMFDPDNFKEINDTFGHGAGDCALKEFTSIVEDSLREIDVFGRVGGDEFAAVLLETSLDDAVHVAERIRHAVENHNIEYEGHTISFTVSIGAVEIDVVYQTFEMMMKAADVALYAAKKQGRNRIERTVEEAAGPGDGQNPMRH